MSAVFEAIPQITVTAPRLADLPIEQPQWLRKATLIVRKEGRGRDLSELRFKFATQQFDYETPNNASIRVYNLSDETVHEIRNEYDSVVLQAGYEEGPFGTIFAGTINQFGIGRESNVDGYLDLLVSDGDLGYNFGLIASTIGAGRSLSETIDAAAKAMGMPVKNYEVDIAQGQLGMIRPKVSFGLARDVMRDAARSLDARWSIQNGEIHLTPLDRGKPGEAAVINSLTGMIGIPELTNNGVTARVLLNPNLKVGGLVKINNKDVNAIIQQNPAPAGQRLFNSWFDVNHLAKLQADGLYVLLQVEHHGGPREPDYYSELIMMAAKTKDGQILPYG